MKRIIIMLALLIHLLCPSSVLAGELLIGPSTRVLNQFHGAPMPQGLAGFGGTIQTRSYGVDYGGEILNLGNHRIDASLRLGRWIAFGQGLHLEWVHSQVRYFNSTQPMTQVAMMLMSFGLR